MTRPRHLCCGECDRFCSRVEVHLQRRALRLLFRPRPALNGQKTEPERLPRVRLLAEQPTTAERSSHAAALLARFFEELTTAASTQRGVIVRASRPRRS